MKDHESQCGVLLVFGYSTRVTCTIEPPYSITTFTRLTLFVFSLLVQLSRAHLLQIARFVSMHNQFKTLYFMQLLNVIYFLRGRSGTSLIFLFLTKSRFCIIHHCVTATSALLFFISMFQSLLLHHSLLVQPSGCILLKDKRSAHFNTSQWFNI